MTEGIILKCVGGFYYVKTADGVIECKPKGIFRKTGIKPVAGDRVTLENECGYVISEVGERRNLLERPPIANVDRLFMVVSSVSPAPNCFIIDKMTAIAVLKGIEPVIVFTKSDLEPVKDFVRIYQNAGFTCITAHRAGYRSRLRALMKNKVSVFTGNTGVGKSTLLNDLIPGCTRETGDVSVKLGRGRHTTREVEFTEAFGGLVADTPGFSALEFVQVDVEARELENAFPEFSPYLGKCRFADCSHRVEKGCAVLEALADKRIENTRHASYKMMYEEVLKKRK